MPHTTSAATARTHSFVFTLRLSRADARTRNSLARREQRQDDRRHPHQLRFDAARHADGTVRHARRKRQRLIDVVRPFSGATHDLLHGDERRVAREQAIGQAQRGDLGDAFVVRRVGTEIRQIRDPGSRPEMPKRAVPRVERSRARRESTSGRVRDPSARDLDRSAGRASPLSEDDDRTAGEQVRDLARLHVVRRRTPETSRRCR